jgi:Urate oxidase N-terminal
MCPHQSPDATGRRLLQTGIEQIVVGAPQTSQVGARQRCRKKRGRERPGRPRDGAVRFVENPFGLCRHRARHAGESRARTQAKKVVRRDPVFGQQGLRQIEAMVPGVVRHGPEQSGEGVRRPCAGSCVRNRSVWDRARPRSRRAENFDREETKAPGGCLGIGDEGRQVSRRLRRHVPFARVEQAVEKVARETASPDGSGQDLHDLMPPLAASVDFRNDVAPPLQADETHHRLADQLADPCDLDIEGMEGEQVAATVGRREQGRQIAVAIEAADLIQTVARTFRRAGHRHQSSPPCLATPATLQPFGIMIFSRRLGMTNDSRISASGGVTMKKLPWENLHAALGIGAALAVVVFLIVGHFALLSDFSATGFWQSLFRFLHVLSGVLWIGLLYYFNFVQIPSMPNIPDEQKPAVSKVIAPTALFFFRWAAASTVLFGLIIMLMNRSWESSTISIGMLLGLIMAYNVWFIIWPNQQKALGLVDADADTKKKAARMAMLTSRFNTMLSIPMLYCMVAAPLATKW